MRIMLRDLKLAAGMPTFGKEVKQAVGNRGSRTQLIKPLEVGEHLIEIKGGNTGLGDPQGTDQNIWWNWVKWHITVTP